MWGKIGAVLVGCFAAHHLQHFVHVMCTILAWLCVLPCVQVACIDMHWRLISL